MNKYITILGVTLYAGTNINGLAGSRADAHAPIGVMGDHIHKKGKWMATYSAMRMEMNQIFKGSSSISGNAGYMMAPAKMTMDMNMLGVMYGVTDKLTLMAMSSYKDISMDMQNPAGEITQKMRARGLGDSSISALYQVYSEEKGAGSANAHIGLGLSVPTGNIKKENGIGRYHSIPMQLGSGTYDFTPSITYNHFINEDWSWGTQAKATFHTGTNDVGYTLGDSFNLTSWVARNINKNFSVSGRVNFKSWSGFDGQQNNGVFELNPTLALPTDPQNFGGTRTDLYIGLNYLHESGVRLATELGKTIHQDIQGVQLGGDWSLNFGLQFAW